MMNNPELYSMSNKVQKQSTVECLREHTGHINWNKIGDTAIDLGCGDGSTTAIVKNYAPHGSHSYKKFVACDINEKMIKYANQHYADEGITFRVLDMEVDLPEDLIAAFNHVFSFYALHWTRKQEKTFSNIYDLLTDDGDILVTLVGSSVIYDVYRVLAQHPKWKTWLKNVDIFITPYNEMKNPQVKITQIVAKAGFKNIDVKCKECTTIHENIEGLKNMIQAIDPFNMPQKVFDELFKDFWMIGREMELFNFKISDNGDVYDVINKHTIIVICATK